MATVGVVVRVKTARWLPHVLRVVSWLPTAHVRGWLGVWAIRRGVKVECHA